MGFLRQIFYQKISSQCENEFSLRKTVVQIEHNMKIRRLKTTLSDAAALQMIEKTMLAANVNVQ